jgi:hypothetical protein
MADQAASTLSLRLLLFVALAAVGTVPQFALWSTDHDLMDAVAKAFAVRAAALAASVPVPSAWPRARQPAHCATHWAAGAHRRARRTGDAVMYRIIDSQTSFAGAIARVQQLVVRKSTRSNDSSVAKRARAAVTTSRTRALHAARHMHGSPCTLHRVSTQSDRCRQAKEGVVTDLLRQAPSFPADFLTGACASVSGKSAARAPRLPWEHMHVRAALKRRGVLPCS